MRTRFLCWMVTGVAVVAAGWYHRHASQEQARAGVEQRRLEAVASDGQRQIQTTREEISALERAMANSTFPPSAPEASDAVVAATISPSPAPTPKPVTQHATPEFRELQVRAYVAEQRLRFATTLKRLAPDARNPGEFDRILSEFRQTMLDESQTDAGRQQARKTREARLKELFGPDYEQLVEANRNNPAHTIVTEIVRQTFQGSGALTTKQADELTRIVGAHRVTAAKANQPRWDWDAIIADAGGVLDSRQIDDFATAIRFRRVSDQMSALSAPKK
jgi:hypothetical protein